MLSGRGEEKRLNLGLGLAVGKLDIGQCGERSYSGSQAHRNQRVLGFVRE